MRTCLRGLSVLITILIAIPLLAAGGDNKDPAKKEDAKPAAKDAKDAKADNPDKKIPEKKDEPIPKKDDKTDKKDDKTGKKDDKTDKKEKFVWGGEFTGKLKQIEANSQKDMTIEISWQVQEPNLQGQQEFLRTQQDWAKRQFDISRNTNFQQRQQQMYQLQIDMAKYKPNLYTVKTMNKDVPIRAADEIKVRALTPPLEYDDKGNVKKWTAKELKEKRGKEGLPGYESDYEQLRANQIVHVFLKKQAQEKKGGKGLGNPNLKLDDDANLGQVQRYEAVMILIMADAPPRKD
jgi:hypothetical protein